MDGPGITSQDRVSSFTQGVSSFRLQRRERRTAFPLSRNPKIKHHEK